MRPFLVAIMTIALLGGMKWFLDSNAATVGGSTGMQLIRASGVYAIDVTLTFDVGPDEFAVTDSGDAPSLLLLLNGEQVLRRTDTISADVSPIQVPAVEGVVIGPNEFFLQASPSDLASFSPRSARVRITRDGNILADQTIWSDAGDVLQGTVVLEVSEQ